MLTYFPAAGDYDPKWLTTEVAEILHTTHEGPQNRPFVRYGSEFKGSDSMCQILISHFCMSFEDTTQHSTYEAVNNVGKVGCERTFRLSSIHPF